MELLNFQVTKFSFFILINYLTLIYSASPFASNHKNIFGSEF